MSITKNQTVNEDTEIRKLHPKIIYNLSMLLKIQDSWKKLMAIVPKDDDSRQPKFSSEHFSLIEQGSFQQKRGCAEIFLDEWSTMGRKRPTVGKLLDFLVQAELYRAADYIAIEVLNRKEGPKRPQSGPAAPIDIDSLLRESRDDIVESSSLIAGDVYKDPSFQNRAQNPPRCVSQKEKISYPIPAFLDSNAILSSESEESFQSEFSTTDSTNQLYVSEEARNSELEDEKLSTSIPRCLLNVSLSSQVIEITCPEHVNEPSQSSSGNESSNAIIPRLSTDYTISELESIK